MKIYKITASDDLTELPEGFHYSVSFDIESKPPEKLAGQWWVKILINEAFPTPAAAQQRLDEFKHSGIKQIVSPTGKVVAQGTTKEEVLENFNKERHFWMYQKQHGADIKRNITDYAIPIK